MIKQMKKLLALILLIALVGCAEYGSYDECIVKEVQKFPSTDLGSTLSHSVMDYCKTFD